MAYNLANSYDKIHKNCNGTSKVSVEITERKHSLTDYTCVTRWQANSSQKVTYTSYNSQQQTCLINVFQTCHAPAWSSPIQTCWKLYDKLRTTSEHEPLCRYFVTMFSTDKVVHCLAINSSNHEKSRLLFFLLFPSVTKWLLVLMVSYFFAWAWQSTHPLPMVLN